MPNKPEPSNLLKGLMNRLDKGEEVPANDIKKALADIPAPEKAPLIQSLIKRIEPSRRDVLGSNPFKNIEKLRQELQPVNQYAFYQQQVKKIKSEITPEKLINTRTPKKNIRFGSMFLYNYDPKWKEELPYYDTYPLVIPFAIADGGFLGLNLHYLPYYLRFKLLEALYDFESDDKLDDSARLNFEWQMTKGVAGLDAAKPCVKHYLSDHVRSDFLLIPPIEWKSVVMLPLQRFQKAGVGTVWNDSLSKMRK